MKTLEEHWLNLNGLQTHYISYGGSFPILWIPGWVGAAGDWTKHYSLVPDAFGSIGIDLPGFGYTQELSGTHDLAGYCDFLKKFADALKLNSFGIIAFSFGGTLALQFAARYPQLVKFVIVQGTPITWKSLPPILRIARHVIKLFFIKWFAKKIWQSWYFFGPIFTHTFYKCLPDFAYVKYITKRARDRIAKHASWRAIYESAVALARCDLLEQCKKIKCPIFVVDGEKMQIFPFKRFAFLDPGFVLEQAGVIQPTNVIRIPEATHVVTGTHPKEFMGAVNKILDEMRQ